MLGELGGAVKIAVTAPPVDGRANDACVALLAEAFGISRSSVEIVSGQSSRNKVVRVKGLSRDEFHRRLGL